jgi:hypothetical protein
VIVGGLFRLPIFEFVVFVTDDVEVTLSFLVASFIYNIIKLNIFSLRVTIHPLIRCLFLNRVLNEYLIRRIANPCLSLSHFQAIEVGEKFIT